MIGEINALETCFDSSAVKKIGMDAGASVVGIADVGDFSAAPEGFTPADVLPGCRSVIVLGTAFPPEDMDSVAAYSTTRNAMLSNMTDMAKKVAKRIAAAGYSAKAVSASGGKFIDGVQFGYISLKHAAELAGLGCIGRNGLLTSPVYGNLLWLSAVLTDADLMPDEKIQFAICENCNKCVESCPMGALANLAAFGKKDCSKNFKIVNKRFEVQCCLCRRICPHGLGSANANPN